MSKVRQLKTPLDIAVLYMAHIDRRMDSKLLSVLLDVDEEWAAASLEELLSLPFVKEYVGTFPKKCALHDEMQKLVEKHAWQYLDISGEERKRLTRKAIEQYYLPHIDLLKQQQQILLLEARTTLLQDTNVRKTNSERWLLEAETLHYYLNIGKEEGYSILISYITTEKQPFETRS